MRTRCSSVLALVLLSASVLAQGARAQDASGCAKFKWSIERERSAFGTPGLHMTEQGKPLPGIMDPAIVPLQPVASVTFERPPSRKPRDGTFAAVLKTPPIAVAGPYQITVSDDVWIDVIQGGRQLKPTGTTGQRDCPNVRKSVRFDLAAGLATVEISGAAASSVKLDFLPTE
jgi:hypothetical protein